MQLKVFIPSARDSNPYLEEIIHYSKCEFSFSSYKDYRSEYHFVNINWPESLFDWKEPTLPDLFQLEAEIIKWKKHSKLIYTFHDERHHFELKPIYKQLFNLVERSADIFIHLGEHSKTKMSAKFPMAIHKKINHPLYSNSLEVKDKNEARNKLGINLEALVVMAAGRIRNIEERKLILKAFKSIPLENKVLISNNMLPFYVQPDFWGRVKMKRIFHVNEYKAKKMSRELRPPQYLFNFGYTEPQQFSDMASASDIIFIPRINTLNSGNVFLGMTFKKVMVGPAVGNIQVVLKEAGLPVFDPTSKRSVKGAMESAIKLVRNDFTFPANMLEDYHPKTIAEDLDEFLHEIK